MAPSDGAGERGGQGQLEDGVGGGEGSETALETAPSKATARGRLHSRLRVAPGRQSVHVNVGYFELVRVRTHVSVVERRALRHPLGLLERALLLQHGRQARVTLLNQLAHVNALAEGVDYADP